MDQPPPPRTDDEILVRVVAPDFVAGLIIQGGCCVYAAPKLRRLCAGRLSDVVRVVIAQHGWKASVVRCSK